MQAKLLMQGITLDWRQKGTISRWLKSLPKKIVFHPHTWGKMIKDIFTCILLLFLVMFLKRRLAKFNIILKKMISTWWKNGVSTLSWQYWSNTVKSWKTARNTSSCYYGKKHNVIIILINRVPTILYPQKMAQKSECSVVLLKQVDPSSNEGMIEISKVMLFTSYARIHCSGLTILSH